MSVPLVINGTTYNYPQQGNTNWGPTLTAWSTAVTNGMLQTSGINPANLIKSANSSPSTAGFLRLSNGDTIDWRNFGNTGNNVLAVNTSDQLTYNGTPLAVSGGGTVNPGTMFQLGYYASSGTTISSLTSITANRALESDSNGLPIASAVSSTTLAFLDATSSVQTQFNSVNSSISSINTQLPLLAPKASPTFTGTVTVPNAVNPTDAVAFGQVSSVTVPTATITMYGGASAPTGWLLCDGSAVSRTTYSALFAIVGSTFGPGDGSTTFNVPSFANNVPIGAGSIAARGATAGSQNHTLTVGEIPMNIPVIITDPTHNHELWSSNSAGNKVAVTFADPNANGVSSNNTHGDASAFYSVDFNGNPLVQHSATGITAVASGSGAAMSLVQPVLGVTFIIKT